MAVLNDVSFLSTTGCFSHPTERDSCIEIIAQRTEWRESRVKSAPREDRGMFALLAASEGASLPINAVGWTVTILGLLITAAWAAYLYR
jgi:hypothetical protein